MKVSCHIGGKEYSFDSVVAADISIPVDFYGDQVNLFKAPRAKAETWEVEGFTGNTNRGGSCNVEEVTFIPQCNGTHTETVGHIVNEEVFIHDVTKDAFIPSTLISVNPEKGSQTNENYRPLIEASDFVVSQRVLKKVFEPQQTPGMSRGLIIRCLPNPVEKKKRAYKPEDKTPYFSIQAMEYINRLGVEHLVVDFPSVDRLDDEGKLTNHHLFWNITEGFHSLAKRIPSHKTITELVYVPDELKDGHYLMDLQFPAFRLESAPSRPLLYKLTSN